MRVHYTFNPLGNLQPCNHSETILGNLFEAPFGDLIAPERLAAFVAAVPARCADCARRLECQGGCKAAAQVCYGALEVEEPLLRQVLAAC